MKQLSDKTRLVITIVLCSVTAVALVIFILYNFGVFGGGQTAQTKEDVKVYAFIKDYTFDGRLEESETDFSFTATTDKTAGTVTIVINYAGDKKVVSVKPYGVKRDSYQTKVTCAGKTLKLKSLDYSEKTATAVYGLDGEEGAVTISNFIVTETA